jgi:hypothetical protein
MRKMAMGVACAAGILAAGASGSGLALAASQSVYGQRLIIKNSIPEDESKNKIVVQSRSALITVPAPLSAGDPTCAGAGGGGASLEVSSPTSGETVTLDLPCENWEIGGRGGGFRYLDRQLVTSACRNIQIKGGRSIKVTCQGKGPSVLDYDLQLGVHQHPVNVILRLGATPEIYCMQFGGLQRKNGTDAKTYFATRAFAPTGPCPP